MAIKIIGKSGTVADVDGTTFRAIRSVRRPVDSDKFSNRYGSYRVSATSGVMAAALGANQAIFCLGWRIPDALLVVHKLTFSAAVSTTFFAAGVPLQIGLFRSALLPFTSPSGGSSIVVRNANKKASWHDSSQIAEGDFRIGSTSSLSNVGTVETNRIGAICSACPITASVYQNTITESFHLDKTLTFDGSHPGMLLKDQALVLQTNAAIPATGTWTFRVDVDWSEYKEYV